MRLGIRQTVMRSLAVVALAMVMAGTGFAISVPNIERTNKIKESVEWTQAVENIEKLSLKTEDGFYVSEINRRNFILGHYFMRAIIDMGLAEIKGDGDYSDVIEALEILKSFFKGTAAERSLQKLTQSVRNGTADLQALGKVIIETKDYYEANLPYEQNWYLLYGAYTTTLIGGIHLDNDELITDGLAELRKLAEMAPQTVPRQILSPVNKMTRLYQQVNFSTSDHRALLQAAVEIIDLVVGK